MFEREIRKFEMLNKLAKQSGTVILGGESDRDIPLGKLAQAFDLGTSLYNRSAAGLSVTNAVGYYNTVVAQLHPARVLLRLGEADKDLFDTDSAAFDQGCRELIAHIRALDKNCSVALVSLPGEAAAERNRHLAVIAQTEGCEFGDVSQLHIWDPVQVKNVMEFVSAMGRSQKQAHLRLGQDSVSLRRIAKTFCASRNKKALVKSCRRCYNAVR